MQPNELIRDARRSAGLTQRQLAERLGTTQSAIAELESARANPRIRTLQRALRACGRELSVSASPRKSNFDETLIAQRLRMTPGQRLARLESGYAQFRELRHAAARSGVGLA
jgi:transcriptional regulator with XRE-family HTH domain